MLATSRENLFRDRPFDFLEGGGRGSSGFFPQYFLLTVREPKYFFQDKAKTKYFFFSKQHICSKCILLDLYVHVFLEPNIQGYIVYMFVYTCILDIWVRMYMSRDMTKLAKWLCAQRRLRSAWASAQSDQSLRCPHEEALGP